MDRGAYSGRYHFGASAQHADGVASNVEFDAYDDALPCGATRISPVGLRGWVR